MQVMEPLNISWKEITMDFITKLLNPKIQQHEFYLI